MQGLRHLEDPLFIGQFRCLFSINCSSFYIYLPLDVYKGTPPAQTHHPPFPSVPRTHTIDICQCNGPSTSSELALLISVLGSS